MTLPRFVHVACAGALAFFAVARVVAQNVPSAAAPSHAPTNAPMTAPAASATSTASAPTPTAPAAAPKMEMTTYYFVMLMKGPAAGTGTKEEAAAAMASHMAHMKKMADAGKLLVAGPFNAGAASEWRGIWIMKCASIEEATELASQDPSVQTGRLTIKVLPWMTAKGYIRDPEFPMAP